MYKQVLSRLNLPVYLWKVDKDNSLICIFSTNDIYLREGDKLDKYFSKNHISYKDNYNTLLTTGDEQEIIIIDAHILLSKITDDIYSEVHYPICDDPNILYTISNKLRVPLTNILGIISILEDIKLTEKNKKYINIIKNSSYDIVGLSNDIIDIVNLKTDKIKLNNVKVTFSNIIDEVLKIVSSDIKKKELKLNIKIDYDLPDIVLVDISRLVQVIVNIINNSLKFTKNGAINLEVLLFDNGDSRDCPFPNKKTEDGKYKILFIIKDTGTGIDDDQKKIIDRVLNIRTVDNIKYYKNSGFGLLICKDICALMGGDVWYKSEEDMGSVFYFTIECDGIKLD